MKNYFVKNRTYIKSSLYNFKFKQVLHKCVHKNERHKHVACTIKKDDLMEICEGEGLTDCQIEWKEQMTNCQK